MEWIPVQHKGDVTTPEAYKPKIRISLVRPVKDLSALGLGAAPVIKGTAGVETLPSDTNEETVNKVLAMMGATSPEEAAKILGTKTFKQMMQPEGVTKRYRSSVVYNIFAYEDRSINIVSHDYSKSAVTDELVYASNPAVDPAYIDYNRPGYFALVVQDNFVTDPGSSKRVISKSNPIILKLINLKTLIPPYKYKYQ
jgi:hypothetical protein